MKPARAKLGPLEAAGFWRKGRPFISSKAVKYTDVPIGQPKVIRDFLPRPEDLDLREEDVKVTITLDAYVDLHAKPGAAAARRRRSRPQAPSSSK